MRFEALETAAHKLGLDIVAAFHPHTGDGAPKDTNTLLLLGPHEPGFWHLVSTSPEFRGAEPNPLDRWSQRVIGAWAASLTGKALFPSDGPPYPPFISWALKSGRCWSSPVGMLVHDHAGLFVSFRGAIALQQRIDLPTGGQMPCTTCPDKPCLTACPVSAIGGENYDVNACHGHLDTLEGTECLSRGCAVRRACPISRAYGRLDAQSEFHMKAFHPK